MYLRGVQHTGNAFIIVIIIMSVQKVSLLKSDSFIQRYLALASQNLSLDVRVGYSYSGTVLLRPS